MRRSHAFGLPKAAFSEVPASVSFVVSMARDRDAPLPVSFGSAQISGQVLTTWRLNKLLRAVR
jgi:hypothetical protein